jgi:putative PIN family toxin of toxin-antitoxin system
MIGAVFDTSILVAALRSRTGAANAVLREVGHQRLRPMVTTALFLEYEAVLKRPEHRLVHGLDEGGVDRFLAALASACAPVEISFHWRPQLTDADDEMVLEAAANGRADMIVTHNVKDFVAAAGRFGIRVLKPGDLLEEMRS